MKLGRLYELIVKRGMEKDPRTAAQIRDDIARKRREYLKAKGPDKAAFDKESLKNPYADTRILYGDPETEVRVVMVGVDMEAPELILADRLNQRGEGIDLVIAHHPEGKAWGNFYDVMHIHQDVLEKFGIPLEVGREMMKERIAEVERSVSPANHSRSVDVARLLGIPFMCAHTPADNQVTTYLQKLFDTKRPGRVSNVLDILKGIPEYRDGMRKHAGPRILLGDPKKAAGKIFVDMTGGTEGPKKIFARLSQAGVGTMIAMHLDEKHFECAKSEHINVVIAGHIASDNLGLNLLLDSVLGKEEIKVIPCSGFFRVKR
jgi:putative NIF3 family GTP cyclohydrolase 1 type 2